jgi:hypothetical protein
MKYLCHLTSIEGLVIIAKRNYDQPLRDSTNPSGLAISTKDHVTPIEKCTSSTSICKAKAEPFTNAYEGEFRVGSDA